MGYGTPKPPPARRGEDYFVIMELACLPQRAPTQHWHEDGVDDEARQLQGADADHIAVSTRRKPTSLADQFLTPSDHHTFRRAFKRSPNVADRDRLRFHRGGAQTSQCAA